MTFMPSVAGAPPTGAASGDLSGTYPGPTVAKIGGTAFTLPASIANGGTGAATAGAALAALGTPALQATTGLTGYTLVNGTGNVITWTTPNDGAMHRVTVISILHVTSTETGGVITLAWTTPDNTSTTNQIFAAGGATGTITRSDTEQLVPANTAVTISQTSALTGGAATVFAEIWGF